jgi:transketolase
MRNAFAEEALRLAGEDDRYFLLSGDIGNRLFNDYKERYSDRFLNCGIAEANMTGVAAGLAIGGFRPMSYTITAFNTVRCLEQIRIDLCYNNLPVTVVGVGSGLSYAGLGYTHHATEDIALMRALPNMNVLCPGDAFEVKGALRAAHAHDGPVYVRIGKKGEETVHEKIPEMKIGGALVIRGGNDVCLLAVGSMLPITCQAADILAKNGISAQVISFYSIKPLPYSTLENSFDNFSLVVSVEEHSRIGGAGTAIGEWLVDNDRPTRSFVPIALPDKIFHAAGDQEYARSELGLDPEQIAEMVLQKLGRI